MNSSLLFFDVSATFFLFPPSVLRLVLRENENNEKRNLQLYLIAPHALDRPSVYPLIRIQLAPVPFPSKT